MAKIIVAGLINIETTLKIDEFPIHYSPVRYPFFGIRSTVSGVGYNVTKALTSLGHEVDFLSLIGTDYAGEMIRAELKRIGVSDKRVQSLLEESPQSVILFDSSGKRMIHTDLKNIQETLFPLVHFQPQKADLAVLCNINFSRAMLERAKEAGVPIATDVHVIRSLDDEYNRDYMAMADILFMSDEALPTSAEHWIHALWERYGTAIVGIGLGSKGALLGVKADNAIVHVPAKVLRPIVNTIGAGDALFSAFVHGYVESKDPYRAMQKAVLFAGYKIGTTGAAEGFMTARDLADAEF
jgi:sugar/nucleoside kinase (ribokinase family)